MAQQRYDLDGKVVFITGSARGIGLAAAKRLSARGAKLVLVGLEADLLAHEAAALGGEATWFHADVTDRDALKAAADGAIEHFGGIDVIIANAGLSSMGTVRSTSDDAFDRTIAVNLTGVWNTLRCGIDSVIERQGYFLTIASLSALAPAPGMGPYTASKAAVENLGRALHMEVAHTGARSGVAYFGFIDTDLVRHAVTHPSVPAMQKSQPKFVRNPVPVSQAAKAIERGVERRSLTVVAPWWVKGVRGVQGFMGPMMDRAAHDKTVVEGIRLAEEHPWDANDPADAKRSGDPAGV